MVKEIKETDCSNVSSLFGKYFHGQLGDDSEAMVLHHITECSVCRDKWIDIYHTKTKESSLNIVSRIKNFFKRVK